MSMKLKITSLILALVMMLTVCGAMAEGTDTLTQDEIDSVLNTTTDASQVTSPFIEVSNAVRNSIVGVNNYKQVTTYTNGGWGNSWGYGWGNNYGGYQRETKEQLYATGSGVVITAMGHILTNYHVIEDASRVTITVANDETEYEAAVVGYDADLDIAVLLVEGLNVEPVTLGDSDQLQVGEWAIVVGNPLGETFARTLTVGVVSALDRSVTDTTYDRYGRKTSITNTMIQVDAAINSGNSGGGMFNVLGQLMGIPERKYTSNSSSSADVDNIGMCIPINVAKPLIESVLQDYAPGKAAAQSASATDSPSSANGLSGKPRMGVSVLTLRNTTSSVIPSGAYVANVESGTPAAEAGIQVGDIIVAVNGTVVKDQSELTSQISSFGAGDQLTITVYRLEGITDVVDLSTWTADLSAAAKLGDGNYVDLSLTLRVVDKIESSKN